jgi:erythronate-4-phosphate dehydrogenase
MDLSLKHTSSLTEGLREAILSAYDIVDDDQRLRESVQGRAVGDIGSNFDRLRRDYPVRREFSKYQISNHAELVTPLKNALAALGFKLNV